MKGRTVRIWDLGGQREGWLLNAETPIGGGWGVEVKDEQRCRWTWGKEDKYTLK